MLAAKNSDFMVKMKLTIDQALQEAIKAHKEGKIQDADRLYTAILKVQPKNADANHNLGLLAVDIGKVEEGLPFLKTALEINPSIAQFWMSYINVLIKLNLKTDAKVVFDLAKNKGIKGKGFDELEKRLSENLEGKSLQHRKFANSPNAEDPTHDQLQLLINLYNRGEFQQALEESQLLAETFPKSAALMNFRGAILKGLGQLRLSIEAYKMALQIKPDYAEAFYNMGNSLKEQGELDEAIDAYQKALTVKSDYAEAYNNMGVIFRSQQKLGEAINAFSNALKIKPTFVDPYNNMGIAFTEQEQPEKAIEAFEKALAIKPNYAEAYNNMGVLLKEQGKLKEAIKAYSSALAIKPNYAEAYNNVGNCLQELGTIDEAIQSYKRALKIKPEYAEAYNNIGNAFLEQGKTEEAIQAYRKALIIKPDYAEALINASSLNTQLLNNVLIGEQLDELVERQKANLTKVPAFQIHQAIKGLLLANKNLVIEHLNNYITSGSAAMNKLKDKDQVFCTAYQDFLSKLIQPPNALDPDLKTDSVIFHLGESHCLSYGHQKFNINGQLHRIMPKITFGGKAFHFANERENAVKAITRCNLDSLPNGSKVFISFGEIDCRTNEGFISAAVKLKTPIETLISITVDGYLKWFAKQNTNKNHVMYFFNVPAPTYKSHVKHELNVEAAKTVIEFNRVMRKYLKSYNFKLIDVYQFTSNEDGYSNEKYHIDGHHLGIGAVPMIELQFK